MAPRWAIYGVNGDWEVENKGIAPDVEVDLTPKEVADGHDKQLEMGVQVVLDELKATPVPDIKIPPYPNYHKNDGLGREPVTAEGKK
jgi:tricorn protease